MIGVGDLVAVVKNDPFCPMCYFSTDDPTGPALGEVLLVTAVLPTGTPPALEIAGYHACWCACGFRPIDKREPCEIEFVELLNRSKRRVSA